MQTFPVSNFEERTSSSASGIFAKQVQPGATPHEAVLLVGHSVRPDGPPFL